LTGRRSSPILTGIEEVAGAGRASWRGGRLLPPPAQPGPKFPWSDILWEKRSNQRKKFERAKLKSCNGRSTKRRARSGGLGMKYEKPCLKVFVAEEASGANCTDGSTAGPTCGNGGSVDDTCYGGSSPGIYGGCQSGTNAGGTCAGGTQAFNQCNDGFYYAGWACGYGTGAAGTCSDGPSATECHYGYHAGTCTSGSTG